MLGAASVLLAAAAFYNGMPLLYPDSIDYLLHGGEAARALLARRTVDLVSTRSFFYALAILPLHGDGALWPIIAFQALLTASMLWLTMRTVLEHASASRLIATTAVLTMISSVSWFVGYVMPDVFTPLLVLGIDLLCFGWERLRAAERILVCALVWLAIVSHGSNLLLAGALAVVVAAVSWLRRRPLREGWGAVARLAGLGIAAALSTVLLNDALLGEPTLGGRRPAFLLARALADGPARTYLEQHCGELDLAICSHADRLPDNVRDALWSPGSVWGSASQAERQRLRDEEMQVVLAGIRSDPWGQLGASLHNAWEQMNTFGLQGSYALDPYITARIGEALPNGVDRFYESRQARLALHQEFFGWIHRVAAWLSLAAVVVLRWIPRPDSRRLVDLSVLTASALVANAAITGALSNVEDRYQSRIVWLLPFVALLVASAWLDRRRGFPQLRESSSSARSAAAR
jgi:hypothetical protein